MGNRLHDGCPDGRSSGWDDDGGDLFRSAGANLIVGVFTPVDTEVNAESAHVHGIETEVTLRPLRWLDLHATYTLLNTASNGQPAGYGSQLLRRPQNTASADLTIRPTPALRFVATLVYAGADHDFLYDNNGNSSLAPGVGQHGLIANVAVNYTATPHVELYVNAWNILNSKFEPVNGYQTPGPTVLAGARIRL